VLILFLLEMYTKDCDLYRIDISLFPAPSALGYPCILIYHYLDV